MFLNLIFLYVFVSRFVSIAGGRLIPRVLVLCKMETISSWIWTLVSVFVSYEDNHYITSASSIKRQTSWSFLFWWLGCKEKIVAWTGIREKIEYTRELCSNVNEESFLRPLAISTSFHNFSKWTERMMQQRSDAKTSYALCFFTLIWRLTLTDIAMMTTLHFFSKNIKLRISKLLIDFLIDRFLRNVNNSRIILFLEVREPRLDLKFLST